MKSGLSFLGILFLAASTSYASDPAYTPEDLATAKQLREQALAGSPAWDIVESLTTEVGPRMAGTAGDAAAVVWAEAKLQELGFDKVWKEPVTFKSWSRGHERAEVVSPYPQPLAITALGLSVGTGGKPLEAEIVAFKSLEDLEAAPAGIARGKIVFISKRMTRHRDGAGYGPVVGARSKGAVEAARKGALGLLIRSVGTDSNRTPHTGMMRYEDGVKRIPAAALSNPDADLLENMLKRQKPVRVRMDLGGREEAEYTSYNVIGEITGAELPDEYVLIGGHLDSWDLGTGAIDDGAGIAITTAAAAMIGQLPERPKRSIRVVMFANEEQGLVGGKAYAEAHKDELDRMHTGAESDFGAGRIWKFSSRVREEALPLVSQMVEVLAPLGIRYGDNKAANGPDLIPVRKLGVSIFALHQDGTDYFDYHHTPNDTLDKIDPEDLNQNVAAYAVFAWLAAQAPIDFGQDLAQEQE